MNIIKFWMKYLRLSAFICGSKLARIHKAGCHPAALTGCGGRVKCRWQGSGRISCLVPPEMLAGTGFSRDYGRGRDGVS